MPAYRCSVCSVNWPATSDYLLCPECEAATTRFSNIRCIPIKKAKSLRLHAEFERFYEKWDAERPPERLTSASGTKVA